MALERIKHNMYYSLNLGKGFENLINAIGIHFPELIWDLMKSEQYKVVIDFYGEEKVFNALPLEAKGIYSLKKVKK